MHSFYVEKLAVSKTDIAERKHSGLYLPLANKSWHEVIN